MKRWLAAALLLVSLAAGSAAAWPGMTRSHARQIAHAVNLTADDVPGYQATSSDSSPGEDVWGGKIYARCSGRKGLGKALADVTASFDASSEKRVDGVESEVEVMPKASYVKQDLRIAGSAKGRACLLKELRTEAAGSPNAELVSATVTKLVPRVAHGVGIHLEMTIRADGTDISFFADVLAVGDRTAEAALAAITTGSPPSRDDEDRLLGILRTRLHAQLHPEDTII